MKRIKVGRLEEFPKNEMREVTIEDHSILMVNDNGTLHALSPTCPHKGAPLADGLLSSGTIVCPWHHACFCAESGANSEPPGQDGIDHYTLSVEGDDVYVEYPESECCKSSLPLMKYDFDADPRRFVVIGSGAAGAVAVETLRTLTPAPITLITTDVEPPYDRTTLSKSYLASGEIGNVSLLREADFYTKHGIEVILNTRVQRVDMANKTVVTNQGMHAFDSLLVAAGASPHRLSVLEENGVKPHYLRSKINADNLIEAAKLNTSALIIGASFIGMESASSLRDLGLDVTVVAPEETPFENVFGPEVGKWIQEKAEDKGIIFKLGKKIVDAGVYDDIPGIHLEDDEVIESKLIVVGAGVEPNTDFMPEELLAEDGGLTVDECMRVSGLEEIPVYAAGDVAHASYPALGMTARIEHWRTAQQQGRIAAMNMAGKQTKFRSIPFFWFNAFDQRLQYVGHADDWDEVVFTGDLDEAFIASYFKDGRLLAALGSNNHKDMCAIEECLRAGVTPDPDDLKADPFSWLTFLGKSDAAAGLRMIDR